MPKFKEVAECWLKENRADKVDLNLIYSAFGDTAIEEIDSEAAQEFFNNLYDNMKVRGKVFSSYEKFFDGIFRFAFERGYISVLPHIERRYMPIPNLFNRPDEAAMERLLSNKDLTPGGTVLRLAWQCGLMRHEIACLLWEQVDFENRQIVLPDRKVPLSDEAAVYLKRLHEQNAGSFEYVLPSRRKNAPMAEQSISALARRVLDSSGQNSIRLNDLRIDFIVRALQENSIEYVSYISGIDIPALQQHYLPYADVSESPESGCKVPITDIVYSDLNKFIEREKTSMAGLAVRFVWQMGVPVSNLPSLTWDAIDFERSTATFEDRTADIPDSFLQILKEVKSSREDKANHKSIILNENKKKPTDAVFIKKAVRQALVNSGILGITLSDLQRDYWRRRYKEIRTRINSGLSFEAGGELYPVPENLPAEILQEAEDELINYLREKGGTDRKTLMAELHLSDRELSLLLKGCRSKGKIVRVGFRYFPAETAICRENQKDMILDYVGKHQPVTSSELADLLGLAERRQIYWIIDPMLKKGELVRIGRNKYCIQGYAADILGLTS